MPTIYVPTSQASTLLVSKGDGNTLIANADPVYSVWIGYTNSVLPNAATIESFELTSQSSFSVDGNQDIYAVADPTATHPVPVNIIPGGTSAFFQPTMVNIVPATAPQLFYSSTPPVGGNLIESLGVVTPATDLHGNAYLAGDTTYWTAGGNYFALSFTGTGLIAYSAATYAGPWNQLNSITVNGIDNAFQISGPLVFGGVEVIYPPSGDATGVTDANWINAFLTNGFAVKLIPGTYYINRLITIYNKSVLRGAGGIATTIFLVSGSNCPMVQTQNFATNTGTGTHGGTYGFEISNILFNGNASGQGSIAAAGIQIYGFDFRLDWISLTNCLATDGLYTEWAASGGSAPAPEDVMTSRYSNLRIYQNTITGAGWHNLGPHDSMGKFIEIYDNGTALSHPATGYFADVNANATSSACIFFEMHVWGFHNYAYVLNGPSQEFHGCVAEGGYIAQVLEASSNSSWHGGQIFPELGASSCGFQIGTVPTESHGFIMDGPIITNFTGTSAATAAINIVNAGTGKWTASIFQSSGQAIWGVAPVGIDYRIQYLQTNFPSVSADVGLGTTPPAPTVANATDKFGAINIGTGTGPVSGTAVDVTFSQPKISNHPTIIVYPLNRNTALIEPYIDNSTISATGFKLGFGVAPAASQPVGTYAVGFADVSG